MTNEALFLKSYVVVVNHRYQKRQSIKSHKVELRAAIDSCYNQHSLSALLLTLVWIRSWVNKLGLVVPVCGHLLLLGLL